ncbi:MAG: TldD/PmbA family protein [bacterium]
MSKLNLFQKVLETCLTTGGDFAEIFYEDTLANSISLDSNEIKGSTSSNVYGCGIRILKGIQEVYGYTNDATEEGLEKLAKKLASNFSEAPIKYEFKLEKVKHKEVINEQKVALVNTPLKSKVKFMNAMNQEAYAVSDKVKQVMVGFTDTTQKVIIANTLGKYSEGYRFTSRYTISVVASDGTRTETMNESLGGAFVFSKYKESTLRELAKSVANSAVELLSSIEMVGGVYDVVIHNAFGGVIFHEACGHSLEATGVAKGLSVFAGKMGEKIAADCVTAIDEGNINDEWGSLAFDDEGNTTKKNVLIENGILKSYMVDYRNSRKMNHAITGNGRRQSYRFSPTSRMTNTYIANGDSTYEEIIANTKSGFFAEKMGGGSVNPATGEYNFSVAKGYLIEDGKLTQVVKGATLIGSGANTLLNVDMVADNCSFGYGMCGSMSGSIAACVGQPTIRVKNMTIGGNGVKK